MHLYRFRTDDGVRLAVGSATLVVDPLKTLSRRRPLTAQEVSWLSDATQFIAAGYGALELAREALASTDAQLLDVDALNLLAPLMPSTILCSGSNYREHLAEKANTDLSGKEPEFFVKTADCVLGPDEPMLHSTKLTTKLDGETELAVVIGKPGRHIALESALDHVFGYTIVNDLSARDLQVRFRADGSAWYEVGRGKVFDGSAPMGPCIVTADELPDPQTLTLKTRVNGQLRQHSNTSQMIFDVAHLVHFFSISMTLKPGMVIITGTPGGTAWSCDASLGGKWQGGNGIVAADGYLKDGDLVESEISGIGVLRTPIVAMA